MLVVMRMHMYNYCNPLSPGCDLLFGSSENAHVSSQRKSTSSGVLLVWGVGGRKNNSCTSIIHKEVGGAERKRNLHKLFVTARRAAAP